MRTSDQKQSGTLRKLNSVVIPIVYSEKFYKDVLDPSLEDINKIGELARHAHYISSSRNTN